MHKFYMHLAHAFSPLPPWFLCLSLYRQPYSWRVLLTPYQIGGCFLHTLKTLLITCICTTYQTIFCALPKLSSKNSLLYGTIKITSLWAGLNSDIHVGGIQQALCIGFCNHHEKEYVVCLVVQTLKRRVSVRQMLPPPHLFPPISNAIHQNV